MQFRTTFEMARPAWQMSHASKIVSIGSCFADCIGKRLLQNKFVALANPYGTIFNPISLFELLTANPSFFEPFYVQQQEIWYNYQVHSSFADANLLKLQHTIGAQNEQVNTAMKEANLLIITLGTAWIYELIATSNSVANCQKQPQKLFRKRLLSVDEILIAFEKCYRQLTINNPNLRVLLTVSPVRHLKDTLPLNAVSKSVLRLACHYMVEKYENVTYFPAYELLTDDLRDYRFYADDLIHPTPMAEQYIWGKFLETYCTIETQQIMMQWADISRSLAHKPFLPQSEAHQVFLRKLLLRLEQLSAHIDVLAEIETVKIQLNNF